MADAGEDSTDTGADVRRARAPSKKKFEEEMEALNSSIRKTEEQLEALKNAGPSSFAEALKNLKAEKNANIERRKKIDADLQKLNKDITEMMHGISRLESTLHYRSEDKIDEAIRRLEWSLKVQNFKLSQEKKIVAEIDSLRRSKKTLMQYLSKKKDKDAMRDRQRRMREERDYYFHKVTQLKQREEKLRSDNSTTRAKTEQLKKELDKLYENKRQMVSTYKKQREDFFDDREKRRHESFKKRNEEKQAVQAALRKEREEYTAQVQPSDDHICLCNTLIRYLQRFVSNTDLEASSSGQAVGQPALPSPSEESAPSGPAEELEDGQYVLLRRPEEDNYVSCSVKHASRKQRRSRKHSMVKRITHTPEVLAQFLQLNLNAPTTVAEILASLEQLAGRKLYYEREAEVRSELSVTESALCEVSRQASHTESNDGLWEPSPSDHLVEHLLLSMSNQVSASSTTDDQVPSSTADDQTDTGENSATGVAASASSERSQLSVSVTTQGKCSQSITCDERSPSSVSQSECSLLLVSHGEERSPSLLPHSVDADSTHSGSRSEGSDSTPRSSCTVEGVACGGAEDSAAPFTPGGSGPESFASQDSGHASSSSGVLTLDTACDCGSNVFYAKKALPGSDRAPCENCPRSVSSELVADTGGERSPRTPGHWWDRLGEVHICEGGTKDLDSPSKGRRHSSSSTNMTLAESTNVSSLEEFPVLVRGGPCELGVSDKGDDLHGRGVFFMQGKQTASLAESTRL
ncbi:uncharacterized protein LOC143290750 [Babylonia areolata]|uniref:uncharacterized protein LOC143290750 n=1 Tax=Babylonia areolata TaxID=304850 RepID=UPI003FCF4595